MVWTAAIDPAEGGPEGAIDYFRPDAPAIIATVPIEMAPPGTRFSAAWRYNKVSLQGLSSEVVVDADGAGRWVSFSLSLPPAEPWPTGTYEITIAIDQQPALRATIDVADRER